MKFHELTGYGADDTAIEKTAQMIVAVTVGRCQQIAVLIGAGALGVGIRVMIGAYLRVGS